MGGSFDERREIYRLLGHLDSPSRIVWLEWCCVQVSSLSVETKVIQSSGDVQEVYDDALSLHYLYGLSLEKMGQELVRRVRGGG